MKTTTVEITDDLLDQARRIAAADGITLRTLVERALRQVIAAEQGTVTFKLRQASVKGRGLQAALQAAECERLMHLAYEGRGT